MAYLLMCANMVRLSDLFILYGDWNLQSSWKPGSARSETLGGGLTEIICLCATLHPEKIRQTWNRGYRLQWLLPGSLDPLPDVW